MKKRYWVVGCVAAFTIFVAMSDGERDGNAQAAHANPVTQNEPKPKPDPVNADASVDYSKPLYVKIGAPLCTNKDDLSNFAVGVPSNSCVFAREDMRAWWLESSGFLSVDCKIRIKARGRFLDLWTTRKGLRN